MSYKFAPAFISDFFTPFYDFLIEQGGLGKSLQKKILKYAQIIDGETILDVGCGSGGLLIMVKANYPRSKVVGIDPDNKILSIARKKLEKKKIEIELLNVYAEKLPFKSSSFDLVISSLTLHHMPTYIKKRTLKEIHRVLKDKGRFLLVDLGKPDSLFWKIMFAIDPERFFSTGKYMKDNLEGRIPMLIKEAGFKLDEVAPRYQGVQFFLVRKDN